MDIFDKYIKDWTVGWCRLLVLNGHNSYMSLEYVALDDSSLSPDASLI